MPAAVDSKRPIERSEFRRQWALAGTTLALGVVYWLLRERDDRRSAQVDSRQGNDPGRVAD